jgi:hypothetical protein
MNKKVRILNGFVFSIKVFVILLFIFVSFLIIQKNYADIVVINQAKINEIVLSKIDLISNAEDSQLATTLALQPNPSYYYDYLIKAIGEKK